jgi:lysophospholipase L1-like esterase
MAIEFTVRAESRFEKSAAAYSDQVRNGYNPNYVHPETRRILLKAGKLPSTTRSWEWQVVRVSDGRQFQKSESNLAAYADSRPSTGFNLPSEGLYECRLIVTSRDGQRQESKVDRINLSDSLIVVIGDSAAAGQGNPDESGKPKEFGDGISGWDNLNPIAWADSAIDAGANWLKTNFTTLSRKWDARLDMDPQPRWLEKEAYRSLRSGAALAAQKQEVLSSGEVVTFLHFARSGSEILAGLLGPRTKDGKKIDGWIGNIGQLEEVKRTVGKRRIDALIISIGVNDCGFSGNLKDLMVGDFGWGRDTQNREAVMRKIEARISQLPGRFGQLNDAINELEVGQVYITEYPTGIFDKMKNGRPVPSEGCEIFSSNFDLDITKRDAEDLKEAARKLNHAIHEAAKAHSWVYVGGIADRFAGHGYCAGRDRLFRTAEESLVIQGDTEGTMHPNGLGHDIISDELSKALRKGLKTHTVIVTPGKKIERPRADTVRDRRDKPKSPAKPRPASPVRPVRPSRPTK